MINIHYLIHKSNIICSNTFLMYFIPCFSIIIRNKNNLLTYLFTEIVDNFTNRRVLIFDKILIKE